MGAMFGRAFGERGFRRRALCCAGAAAFVGLASCASAPAARSPDSTSPVVSSVTSTEATVSSTSVVAPASGPPKFLWGYGDPLLCGPPRPAETLQAGGARVVVVTEAAAAPNPAQRTETTDRRADDAGYVRLDTLLRQFQARHPDSVTLVDLAAKLCPSGPPCPAFVAGTRPRPDG